MLRTNRKIPAEHIRLLIFDLDGTLVDSRLDLANSVNAMLRHFERPELPCDVIASYIGDGAPMLVRLALGDPDDTRLMNDALAFFLAYYREHKLDHTTVYDGVKESLTAIRFSRNGGRALERTFAVLSNKPVHPSRAIVQALGLAEFFVQVYGGNSFPTKKPDPLGARTLLEEAGVEPEEAMIIGDSDIDVLTGRNAGLWTCGVSYGFAPHTLESAPPDVLVDSPAELAELFGLITEARRH
ncbi:MAG TPA: HAD-IA family hydrolase [Terriglobales bacterium]|nr:HAD-IA family hydrolase [Terriglobales bacterium]